MKQRFQLALCAAAAALSLSAQAGSHVQASELPRITNGGTGVHIPPAPDAMQGQAYRASQQGQLHVPAYRVGAAGMHAQEASRAMGHARWSSSVGPAPARHPSWGTPD